MPQTCFDMEYDENIIDNSFCKKMAKYPGQKYMSCYCYSGWYRECPYQCGDDPYNLHPETQWRRELDAKIAALPVQLRPENQPQVDALLKECKLLCSEQRGALKHYSRLKGATSAIKAVANQESLTNNAIESINQIPDEITLDSRKTIRWARRAYHNVPLTCKKNVSNYPRLTDAEQELDALLVADWEIPRNYARVSPGMGETSGRGLNGFAGAVAEKGEAALIWLCKTMDPRRRKRGNILGTCRFMLLVSLWIGMSLVPLLLPQHIWITALVLAGCFFTEQVVSHIQPKWIWVRGGLWAATVVAGVVLTVMVLMTGTPELWKNLAMVTLPYPAFALIARLISIIIA